MVSDRHDKVVSPRRHQEGGHISLLCAAKMTPLLKLAHTQPSFTIIDRPAVSLISVTTFLVLRTLPTNFSRPPHGVSKARFWLVNLITEGERVGSPL